MRVLKCRPVGIWVVTLLATNSCSSSVEHAMTEGPASAGVGPQEHRSFKVTPESISPTEVSLDGSGSNLLFSALGDIFEVSVETNEVRRITAGPSWDTRPQYSPDDRYISFASDRDGGLRNVWLLERSTGEIVRLSDDVPLGYSWSINGEYVFVTRKENYGSTRGAVRAISVSTGESHVLIGESGQPINVRGAFVESFEPDSGYYVGGVAVDGKLTTALFEFDRKRRTTSRVDTCGFDVLGVFGASVERGRVFLTRHLAGKFEVYVCDVRSGEVDMIQEFPSHMERFSIYQIINGSISGPEISRRNRQGMSAAWANGSLWLLDTSTGDRRQIPVHVAKNIAIANFAAEPKSANTLFDEEVIRWLDVDPDKQSFTFQVAGEIWQYSSSDRSYQKIGPRTVGELASSVSVDSPTQQIAYVTYHPSAKFRVYVAGPKGQRHRLAAEYDFPIGQVAWVEGTEKLAMISYRRLGSLPTTAIYPISWPQSQREIQVLNTTTGETTVIHEYVSEGINSFSSNLPRLFYHELTGRLFFLSRKALGLGRNLSEVKSVSVKGGPVATHAKIDGDFFDFVPSPDGRHGILILGYSLWLVPLEPDGARELAVQDVLSDMVPLKVPGSTYTNVSWIDENTVAAALGKQVYLYSVSGRAYDSIDIDVPGVGRSSESPMLVLKNANIITVDKQGTISAGLIAVHGKRIHAVAGEDDFEPPDDAVCIDLGGRYVIPGLIDTHSHPLLASNSHEVLLPNERALLATVAYGVTTVFDPAASTVGALGRADAIKRGNVLGPRIFSTGRRFQEHATNSREVLSTRSVPRAAVPDVVGALSQIGVDLIKTRGIWNRTYLQAIASAARDNGLGVTAHIEHMHYEATRWTSVVDGFAALEHYRLANPVYDDEVQLLGAAGASITVEIEGFRPKKEKLGSPKYSLESKLVSFGLDKVYGVAPSPLSFTVNVGLDGDGGDQPWLQSMLSAGVNITLGSHHKHGGPGLHRVAKELQSRGLSGGDVLELATINGARKIGLDRYLGSITPGKFADLVILGSDPSVDIRNLRDIDYVVLDGKLYDDDSLTELFPSYRPLLRPYWQDDRAWASLRQSTHPALDSPAGNGPATTTACH